MDWAYCVYCGGHTAYFYEHEYELAQVAAEKYGSEVKPLRRRVCR